MLFELRTERETEAEKIWKNYENIVRELFNELLPDEFAKFSQVVLEEAEKHVQEEPGQTATA